MPNVSNKVFQAINQAADSDKDISKKEFYAIKAAMREEGGIDKNEQAVLDALEKGNEVVIAHGTEKATISPKEVNFPTKAEPFPSDDSKLDASFFLRLANMTDEKLYDFFPNGSENKQRLQTAYNNLDTTGLKSGDIKKLEALGPRLQKFQDIASSDWAYQRYNEFDADEIAQDFVNRVDGPQDARVRPEALRNIAEDLRLVTVSGYPEEFKNKVYDGLFKALGERGYRNSDKIPMIEIRDAIANLTGPGSAAVKARFIKLAMERYPDPRRGQAVEAVLRSDPSEVIGKLEYMADGKDKLLLNKALDAVAKTYANDPDRVADTLGELIGSASRDYARAVMAKPPDEAAIKRLGKRVGYMNRAAEKTVETLAKVAKGKVDRGAFIARMFTSGIAKLSGVGAIGKIGDKVIDEMKKREYKSIDQWQKGIDAFYQDVLRGVIMSRAPRSGLGSEETDKFADRQDTYEDGVQAGYQNHLDEEKSTASRTKM